MDENADYHVVPNITYQVVVPTPIPIFVGTYSHVLRGYYRGSAVAVKVLRLSCPTLHAMRRKMSREREVWGRLKHPNIVSLLGYTDESEIFGPFGALVSKWCEYGDAAKYLRTHDLCMYSSQRKKLWCDVVKGVNYLHSYDPVIVHGDLKPGNVLIDWGYTAKICDFGLVQILLEEGHSGLTTTSEHTGTLRYLAPELILAGDGARPTISSDIYAMGCVGLEFLFDQLPFANRANNRTGHLHQDIKNGIPPCYPPEDLSLGEEATHWEILEQCWAWDPSIRKSAWVILELLTLIRDDRVNTKPINIPKSVWEIERSLRHRVFDMEGTHLEDQMAQKEDKFDHLLLEGAGSSAMQLEEDFLPRSYAEPSPMSTSSRRVPSVIMASRSNSHNQHMLISPNLSVARHPLPMSISPPVSNLQKTRPSASMGNLSRLRYSTLPE